MSTTTLSRKKSLYLSQGEESQREYVLDFPNTGKMMDIELMKIQISDGKFDTLKYSFNPMFVKQATRIEAIATFAILLPSLKADLNVKSMLDLSYEQMELIESMYIDQFLPWYEEWMALLNKPKEVKKEEANKEV